MIVDIAVEKFVSTSLMDIDVHPLWFQCKIKDKLILLHFPEEVEADKVKVQRIQANGHLMLIVPKLNGQAIKAPQPTVLPKKASGGFMNEGLKPLGENYRKITTLKQHSQPMDDSDVPPLE